ncbi:16S rRNA (uracil(1498)-N(3))-methyltransferase [Methylocapsa polymorpha]|uniref:Ribosomal RNA small subunit methyltransferase E n=1 Tax=Methylocapsa polymorpha TaxID=3080828 RepID=A0ABZ0HMS3_9HYPH|nr:16S rRNA (uracil(1498)-N(3))-methyltransferase [Methylocapsa sp. RX1]
MPRYDFTTHRLFVEGSLVQGARIELDSGQANYIRNVLRLPDGAEILAFNGRDGEWRAAVVAAGRKSVALVAKEMVRPQPPRFDLHYLFAPLKHARQDYMIQKAVEMGAGLLRPALTRRTQAERINFARMRANAIEAAEQCGILAIPEIAPAARLDVLLGDWEKDRILVFCDEDAPVRNPIGALRPLAEARDGRPLAVLIGPEGGFDSQERDMLLSMSQVVRLSLGPRILRADTAAVAALTLVQAELGDWREDDLRDH